MYRTDEQDENNVIPVVKYCVKYLILFVAALFVGLTTAAVVNDTRNMNKAIIQEAIVAVQTTDNDVMHHGYFFAKNQGCFFSAYDENGTLLKNTEPPTCGVFAVSDEITIDGIRYVFSSCSAGQDICIYGCLIALIIIGSVIILHVNNIIELNTNTQKRYAAARIYLTDCEDEGKQLDEIFSKKHIKKYFNFKLCFIVPIAVVCLCIMVATQSVYNYGVKLTDRISGVIQHYGVIHSDKLIEDFNQMDNIRIEIDDADYWELSPMTKELTLDQSNEIRNGGNGYSMENGIAKNYKLLNCGRLIRVDVNMREYNRLVFSYIVLLAAFMVYEIIKLKENDAIDIISQ